MIIEMNHFICSAQWTGGMCSIGGSMGCSKGCWLSNDSLQELAKLRKNDFDLLPNCLRDVLEGNRLILGVVEKFLT